MWTRDEQEEQSDRVRHVMDPFDPAGALSQLPAPLAQLHRGHTQTQPNSRSPLGPPVVTATPVLAGPPPAAAAVHRPLTQDPFDPAGELSKWQAATTVTATSGEPPPPLRHHQQQRPLYSLDGYNLEAPSQLGSMLPGFSTITATGAVAPSSDGTLVTMPPAAASRSVFLDPFSSVETGTMEGPLRPYTKDSSAAERRKTLPMDTTTVPTTAIKAASISGVKLMPSFPPAKAASALAHPVITSPAATTSTVENPFQPRFDFNTVSPAYTTLTQPSPPSSLEPSLSYDTFAVSRNSAKTEEPQQRQTIILQQYRHLMNNVYAKLDEAAGNFADMLQEVDQAIGLLGR